jgi:hypothetical protein
MKLNVLSRMSVATAASALLLGGSGCASTYQIRVNATHRDVPAGRDIASYHIAAKDPVVAADSLRYQEIAQHVRTALSARGLYEAPDAERGDMVVEIDYGVAAPRVKTVNYSVPVFTQSGWGNYDGPLAEGRSAPPDRLAASLDSSSKELVAFNDLQSRVIVREKHISICARDNAPAAEGRPPVEFWRIDVSVENEGRDLRAHLPILVSAAMDQIGTTTTCVMTLKADDEAVRFIKKGM